MEVITHPISAVIPTANRPNILRNTLVSLAMQAAQPAEIVIIDASDNNDTQNVCNECFENLSSIITYQKAIQKGAAIQRNQGVEITKNNFILFCDDDILFEQYCIERLWDGINSDSCIGGVNAIITNQLYLSPGKISSIMYRLMNGKKLNTYAGKCIGPAWNLLPEDNNSLPNKNEVDWLNLGCTIYRKEALPNPVFPDYFKGYSMMEDLTLSSIVGKKWSLFNIRTARIFHDTQPGTHKSNVFKLAKMELINRHHVMTVILNRRGYKYEIKLCILELFFMTASLKSFSGFKNVPFVFCGKIAAIFTILKGEKH